MRRKVSRLRKKSLSYAEKSLGYVITSLSCAEKSLGYAEKPLGYVKKSVRYAIKPMGCAIKCQKRDKASKPTGKSYKLRWSNFSRDNPHARIVKLDKVREAL